MVVQKSFINRIKWSDAEELRVTYGVDLLINDDQFITSGLGVLLLGVCPVSIMSQWQRTWSN